MSRGRGQRPSWREEITVFPVTGSMSDKFQESMNLCRHSKAVISSEPLTELPRGWPVTKYWVLRFWELRQCPLTKLGTWKIEFSWPQRPVQ